MLKAISVRQPWAWFIVQGFKDIENRDWQASNPGLRFRGPVLIHASSWWQRDEGESDLRFAIGIARELGLTRPEEPTVEMIKGQRGGIVGQVTITDVVGPARDGKRHPSPWFFGQYGLVLTEQRELPFRACKGSLGFFNPPLPAEPAVAS